MPTEESYPSGEDSVAGKGDASGLALPGDLPRKFAEALEAVERARMGHAWTGATIGSETRAFSKAIEAAERARMGLAWTGSTIGSDARRFSEAIAAVIAATRPPRWAMEESFDVLSRYPSNQVGSVAKASAAALAISRAFAEQSRLRSVALSGDLSPLSSIVPEVQEQLRLIGRALEDPLSPLVRAGIGPSTSVSDALDRFRAALPELGELYPETHPAIEVEAAARPVEAGRETRRRVYILRVLLALFMIADVRDPAQLAEILWVVILNVSSNLVTPDMSGDPPSERLEEHETRMIEALADVSAKLELIEAGEGTLAVVVVDANLRSGPSAAHPSHSVLIGGTPVRVLAVEEGWCNVAVEIDGEVRAGWVSADLLSAEEGGAP